MATVELLTDEKVQADPRVKRVFDDIRATRKSDFMNTIWRMLANQPALLEQTGERVKAVMVEPGALDPLTRELIYIAVSTANGCGYCVHSHTAAAKQKGMTAEQYGELQAIVALASQTNALATMLQVPVDDAFLVG
jgi:AhpD family alkylhydroperoxidase